MRLVVDTNIFISALLKESSWPGAVVRRLDQFGGLLKSEATEQEVFAVLGRPRFAQFTPLLFADRLHSLFDVAELVTITESVTGCRDPKDDKFLELAVNGRRPHHIGRRGSIGACQLSRDFDHDASRLRSRAIEVRGPV